ncbi:MAG: hypothetical protein IJ246_04140 [Clostridia bacterium]|nr:hypothetical protein [Clostridia bacterium]
MKSGKRHASQEEQKSTAEYYHLHTQAVDDLVNASEENSPEVSREELRKYTSHSRLQVADWVKLLLIKWWFAAAVCFFFLWGLGTYLSSTLDLIVIAGIALGFETDLLTNNVLRFVAKQKGANDRWMMYPRKGFISLPLNVLHAGVILFLVYTAYNALNGLWITLAGLQGDAVPLGVEPILSGLLCLGFDLMLIAMKHGLETIVSDAKRRVRGADASRGK